MLQPSESKPQHDAPAPLKLISYTGREGCFLFEITTQKQINTFFLASYVLLPGISLRIVSRGAGKDFYVRVNAGQRLQSNDTGRKHVSVYLFPVSSIFCHHFPQCLQHLDAQALLVLLQQLLSVFDQSGQGQKSYFFSTKQLRGAVSELHHHSWDTLNTSSHRRPQQPLTGGGLTWI